MAQAKTMTGARAKVYIDGKPVGIFTNVSYSLQYDGQPIHILGKFGPAEIVITGQEAIQVQASGYRIIGNGPHKAASVPMLQDLMNHEDIQITIVDRKTSDGSDSYMTVSGVRPLGYSTSISARGLQEVGVNFLGLVLTDESGAQNDPGASIFE